MWYIDLPWKEHCFLNSAGIAQQNYRNNLLSQQHCKNPLQPSPKTGLYQTLFGAIVGTDDHLHCIAILIYAFNYVCNWEISPVFGCCIHFYYYELAVDTLFFCRILHWFLLIYNSSSHSKERSLWSNYVLQNFSKLFIFWLCVFLSKV